MKKVKKLRESTILTRIYFIVVCIFSLSFISCSTYIQYLEKQDNKNIELLSNDASPLYCNHNNKENYNIVHESESGKEEFTKILNSLQKQKSYSISELGLYYTLYNSIVRPDATNWNGRLQFYIHQNGSDHYFDFYGDKANFETAVSTFRSKKISNLYINDLLKKAQAVFPNKFTVQKKFSEFLEENKSLLSQINLKKYYRLDKALQKGETFLADPTHFNPNQIKNSHLPDAPFFPTAQNNLVQCNFDSNLYNSGIFIIHDNNLHENTFSLLSSNGDFILITTSAGKIKKPSSKLGQSQVELPSFNTPMCKYKDQDKEIISIANQSRDSGQLLHHLNQYQYFESKNLEELIQYTSYARHLFLINPPRMLYESKRGTPKELNSFLALNFPVYHAQSIGQIISIAKFNSGTDKYTFVQDERVPLYQSCIK